MNKQEKPWFSVRDLAEDEAELVIFDEIGGWGQSVDDFKRAFDQVKNKKAIKLFINSPGGVVTDGWAIFNMLQRIRDKLTVEVIGLAASMASVVALAGKKLTMCRGSYFMIHNPWTIAWGDSTELRKMADTMDKMREDIITLYNDRSALTRDEIVAMMDEETWISADDAQEYGFADSITDDALVAASASKPWDIASFGFRHAPTGLACVDKAAHVAANDQAAQPEKEEKVMETNTTTLAAAEAAKEPVPVQALDDKAIEMIAAKVAPSVLKMVPAARALENKVKDDKFPEWFMSALAGRDLHRGIPRDSAAVIKTSDGFGIPTVAIPEFLQNLNYYSIARRWGSQVFSAGSVNSALTVDVVQNAAAIITEGNDYTDKGEPTSVAMALVKLGGRYSITEEATEDSVLDRFAAFQKGAAIAIAKAENKYFLTGSGSGQPKGIFTETATKTVASASAITYAELLEFDESLSSEWNVMDNFDPARPELYRGPVYVMNPATASYIRTLNDAGTPANYYFQDKDGAFRTLFGKPVIRDSNVPTITNSAKVLALVNFNGYAIAERRPNLSLYVGVDPDSHATNWDFAERVDGKLWNTGAAKILAMKS